MKISATIITLNEERNLPRAIESLRCCDEIVVVDSGSTDKTIAIAERYGARVVCQPWLGYAKQKNAAAAAASYDWILSLDADEALSEELEGEIWALKTDGPKFDAYTMPRLAQYIGRWIQHSGWYPDRKIRLYHREKARWEGDFVHESVKTSGTVGQLESNLLHFTCDTFAQHFRSLDRYTSLAADELIARQKPLSARHLTLDPAWSFMRSFFVQRGYRDGMHGLAIAWMAALYTFLKYAKARMNTR